VQGLVLAIDEPVNPIGSFTDPEYAQVGLTERKARETRDIITATIPFDTTTRAIIDGHPDGFCKLVVDRATATIVGCHVVGDRAVEIVQVAAIAMAGSVRVDTLARMPLSFPTYAGILGRAAATTARLLRLDSGPIALNT
jgi:dihydrolipoamide dehydrogenase